MAVPNRFPIIESPLRIALIGEAPGEAEESQGRPFVGASGYELASRLSQVGTSRDACFVGNVCQYRPPGNNIFAFQWDGFQIQQGLEQLRKDILMFRPNIVVCLGNTPLKAARNPVDTADWNPRRLKYKNSNWRGSMFLGDPNGPFPGIKCISTVHPAYVLRDYDQAPLLSLDLAKAVRESRSPELRLPKRELIIPETAAQCIALLNTIRAQRKLTALDIEGYLYRMSCISFSNDPSVALTIPFFRRNYAPCWSANDELAIFRTLAGLLEDPAVPKCLQNSLYDRFVLHYSYGIRIRNVTEDTMLKHWELNSEMGQDDDRKKGKRGLNLGLMTSIYTDEPYYKSERGADDDKTFYEYCAKDSALTLEIALKLQDFITQPCSKEHYRINVALLEPVLYMELRGMRYDVAKAAQRRDVLQQMMYAKQAELNALTGHCFAFTSLDEIHEHVRNTMLVKKGDRPRKEYEEQYAQYKAILNDPRPSIETIGRLESVTERGLNISAPAALCRFLYDELGLPEQFNPPPRGSHEAPSRTADYEALLKLAKHCDQHSLVRERRIIALCIELRALETRQRMLGIGADADGRIRCGYNIVGSNTGRITCYESPTGSGYNLQTIPNYTNPNEAPGGVLGDRDLFLADNEHWFFQCDLKGADGWTVAAYCAMLGDRTMLDDYLYGLKPYQILACKVRGYQGDYRDRAWLKTQCARIEKDAWDAFAAKRVQHGAAYLEGNLTISRNILKDSEGKLYYSPSECAPLKDFFMQRYWGIPKWHQWVSERISKRPILRAASGQVRQFNGRPDEILTKAVAFEPQANTTYATNLAMFRLWNDPENRIPWYPPVIDFKLAEDVRETRLRIEPLHQVHDALCGQFRKDDTAWAVAKIKSFFDNPLNIAGQRITIPFDGAYGPSWGDTSVGKI